MTDLLTTAEVAEHLRCSRRKVLNLARELRVGINLGGKAGMRFSPAELDTIVRSLRPEAPEPRRRRRRT